MTKRLDMSDKGKKITITSGRKPLDGVNFSSQTEKRDILYHNLKKAHERAQYYADQMMRAKPKNIERCRDGYWRTRKEIEEIEICIKKL